MNLSFWEFLLYGSACDPMSRSFKNQDGELNHVTDVIDFKIISTKPNEKAPQYSYEGKINYTDPFTRNECTIDDHVVVKTVPQNVRQEKITYWQGRCVQTMIMIIVGGVPAVSCIAVAIFRKILYGAVASWFSTALMVTGVVAALWGAYRWSEANEEKMNWKDCIEDFEGGIAGNRQEVKGIKDSGNRFLYVRNFDLSCIAFSSEEVLGFWKKWVEDLCKDYTQFTIYSSLANRESLINNFFKNNPYQSGSLACIYKKLKDKKVAFQDLEIPNKEKLYCNKFEALHKNYTSFIKQVKKDLRHIDLLQKRHFQENRLFLDRMTSKIAAILKDDNLNLSKNDFASIVKVYQEHLNKEHDEWRSKFYDWINGERTLLSVEQFIEPITQFVHAVKNEETTDDEINALPEGKIPSSLPMPVLDKDIMTLDKAIEKYSFNSDLIQQFRKALNS